MLVMLVCLCKVAQEYRLMMLGCLVAYWMLFFVSSLFYQITVAIWCCMYVAVSAISHDLCQCVTAANISIIPVIQLSRFWLDVVMVSQDRLTHQTFKYSTSLRALVSWNVLGAEGIAAPFLPIYMSAIFTPLPVLYLRLSEYVSVFQWTENV